MTDAATTPNAASSASDSSPAGKVVELRQAVQERAGALNGWAHDQARALASTAKEKPLAAAGISAGAAFAAGLVLGLLLSRTAQPEPTWRDRLMELKPQW